MDNEEQLPEEDISVWEDLLDELFALNYIQVQEILEVERKIYTELQQKPNNLSGLITLMYCQVMLGNKEKAKTLATRIWEIGGDLDSFFEFVYVENLLNLGMLDMALVLLRPRIENLRDNLDLFYPSLTKFAVMTGNLSLLKRIGEYPDVPEEDEILFELADIYGEAQYAPVFKGIMKLILENMTEHQCSYEYELYDDRGFPEMMIVIYVNNDKAFCARLEASLEDKISALWTSMGQEQMNNIGVEVVPIQEHEGWNTDNEEDGE